MDYRSLKLQGIAILLAMAIFTLGFSLFDLQVSNRNTALYIGVFLVSYFILFAGAHLYTATIGEESDLPINARWRFVGIVALLCILGAIGWAVRSVPAIAGVEPSFVVGMVAAAAFVGYMVFEARDAYRSSLDTGTETS